MKKKFNLNAIFFENRSEQNSGGKNHSLLNLLFSLFFFSMTILLLFVSRQIGETSSPDSLLVEAAENSNNESKNNSGIHDTLKDYVKKDGFENVALNVSQEIDSNVAVLEFGKTDISLLDYEIHDFYPENMAIIVLEGVSADQNVTVKTGTDPKIYSIEELRESNRIVIRINYSETRITELQTKNNEMEVISVLPKDRYENIVVVDAAYGGENVGDRALYNEIEVYSKEITLKISEYLETEFLDQESASIGLFFLREEDRDLNDSDRIRFANEMGADLYVRIGTRATDSEDTGILGYYNGSFFIPGFSGVNLADLLVRNVTAENGGTAIGLFDAGKESLTIWNAMMPAAEINIGNFNSAKDLEVLMSQEYLEKTAQGILDAIGESIKNIKEQEQN